MAYQKNGQPLSVDNGAPLRLASPIKLGYKQSKWVTQIMLVRDLMPSKVIGKIKAMSGLRDYSFPSSGGLKRRGCS
jgi:DMSO/TMAO reductase YedYZ molybdopterin-dependent catalytic subunit